jgi:hypothetical protein
MGTFSTVRSRVTSGHRLASGVSRWLGGVCLLTALPFLVHCGDDDGMTDSGVDAGRIDAGRDAGTEPDAGFDGGVTDDAGPDAGEEDAGSTEDGGSDGGTTEPDGVIFDDEFGANVVFAPFGGSINVVEASTAEAVVGSASLRVVVPTTSYTGGALVLETGITRDLSSFDAITFYARTDTGTHTLNVVGLGDDAAGNTDFKTELSNLTVDTEWAQFTIPVPNPAKLGAANALFYFAEGSDEGGYTLYLDDVRYVDLADGVVTSPMPALATETVERSVPDSYAVAGTVVSYMVDGTPLTLTPAGRAFFDFESSDTAVATVDAAGRVTPVALGETTVTASLASVAAAGALTFRVVPSLSPTAPPPTPPTRAASDVIAIFSNAYPDSLATVDTFRTDWSGSGPVTMTTLMGDDVLRYADIIFAGITTEAMQVDASAMTHVHIDVWVEGDSVDGQVFTLRLVDFGADGTYQPTDEVSELIYSPSGAPSGMLTTGTWMSLDIPLSAFDTASTPPVGGLTSRAHLAQYVLKSERPGGVSTNLWVDNFYFYR